MTFPLTHSSSIFLHSSFSLSHPPSHPSRKIDPNVILHSQQQNPRNRNPSSLHSSSSSSSSYISDSLSSSLLHSIYHFPSLVTSSSPYIPSSSLFSSSHSSSHSFTMDVLSLRNKEERYHSSMVNIREYHANNQNHIGVATASSSSSSLLASSVVNGNHNPSNVNISGRPSNIPNVSSPSSLITSSTSLSLNLSSSSASAAIPSSPIGMIINSSRASGQNHSSVSHHSNDNPSMAIDSSSPSSLLPNETNRWRRSIYGAQIDRSSDGSALSDSRREINEAERDEYDDSAMGYDDGDRVVSSGGRSAEELLAEIQQGDGEEEEEDMGMNDPNNDNNAHLYDSDVPSRSLVTPSRRVVAHPPHSNAFNGSEFQSEELDDDDNGSDNDLSIEEKELIRRAQEESIQLFQMEMEQRRRQQRDEIGDRAAGEDHDDNDFHEANEEEFQRDLLNSTTSPNQRERERERRQGQGQ